MHETAYAVSTAGQLQSLSLREGSLPRVLAELPPAVASNRAALVRAAVAALPHPTSCLLGVHPGGVEAVVLATGELRGVYAAPPSAALDVNQAGAASGFKGVAAERNCLAFAERRAAGQATLAVLFFGSRRPVERPLTLSGTQVVGPVLHDRLIAAYSEEELGVFDLADETVSQVRWPRSFEPLLARRPDGVHVPPGSTPLTAARTGEGVVVYLGGFEGGVPGMLRVKVQTRDFSFIPLGQGASLSSNADGSLCVAADDEVWVPGADTLPHERAPLRRGMPATFAAPLLACFSDAPRPGWQRVKVMAVGRGMVADLHWEDAACTQATCGAPLVSGGSLSVPYLSPTAAGAASTSTGAAPIAAGEAGLRVAHWSFTA